MVGWWGAGPMNEARRERGYYVVAKEQIGPDPANSIGKGLFL